MTTSWRDRRAIAASGRLIPPTCARCGAQRTTAELTAAWPVGRPSEVTFTCLGCFRSDGSVRHEIVPAEAWP